MFVIWTNVIFLLLSYCAGRRLTLHIRTLEPRSGQRVSKKLGIVYDHDAKGMICEGDDTKLL